MKNNNDRKSNKISYTNDEYLCILKDKCIFLFLFDQRMKYTYLQQMPKMNFKKEIQERFREDFVVILL